ncbi:MULTISPECIES: ATP-binding protein [unclassified Paenibacillus]|uniref:ATP-binding protein n=1 Tax=unclassified Paenibacillus TaxID=185978 RepID=UPI0009557840|nr:MULTISPECIES: ATP-binding protein [unclassified Paenibacillus]ASS68427.1 sensor histidine kinase [Paenibacillus sp. RUD330]SIR32977.1 two-component system, sporulation sensor kinase B [Paenibacillus sp. RU4X]SIR44124.1 two-component system, sporulation sensor kinase B [Paenibacillus sp. RU4T]
MIENIIAREFQGLMYYLTACLLFLIITPRVSFIRHGRKILFVLILIVQSYFYLAYEEIDPLVYALHLTPVCVAMVALFEGWIPGTATAAAFVWGNVFIAGNDWLPPTIACAVVTVLGIIFHYRIKLSESIRLMILLHILLTFVHIGISYGFMAEQGIDFNLTEVLLITAGSLLSAPLVSYTYYLVKHQERMTEELFNAEKYHLIGQLTASISHEVRNPLTTARGFLQLMGKPGLDQQAMDRYRNHALEGIDGANAIITDYLNYSKPSVDEPKPLDIRQELSSVEQWVKPLCVMSGIEFVTSHSTEEPLIIVGDSKKFQQCLLNIMKNGIESMPEGGVLTISTRQENDKALIFIRDTGVGMNEQQLKRIGMPFYTTKDKGTGLGLMVVTNLIKAMGGRTYYRSKPNQGTICEVHLPLAPNPASS